MGGIDVCDVKCTAYKVCRKSRKFWKALFYDYLEIASVNSFILFSQYRKQNPNCIERISSYDYKEFRVSLMRQLGSLNVNAAVPLY